MNAAELLKKHKLSRTESRVGILDLFISARGALAHADVEKLTSEAFDRVTVYRTLNSFVEKGIIHRIPTTDSAILYALCIDNCAQGHHHDNHVHFICTTCNTATCLKDVTVPNVGLPKGFQPKTANMNVMGTCKDCS